MFHLKHGTQPPSFVMDMKQMLKRTAPGSMQFSKIQDAVKELSQVLLQV